MLILKLFGVGGTVPLKRNWVIQLELGTYFLEEVGRARFNLATPTYATVEYSPCSVRKLLGGGGEALTWKGGTGTSGGQDSLFTPLLPLFRSPVAAWFSSLDPTLSKNDKFWLLREKFAKNIKNFQFCSLNLTQISVQALKMLKIFSSLDLTFSWKKKPKQNKQTKKKTSFLDPHFGTLRRTSLPKQKLSAPPGKLHLELLHEECKVALQQIFG